MMLVESCIAQQALITAREQHLKTRLDNMFHRSNNRKDFKIIPAKPTLADVFNPMDDSL